MIWNVLKGKGIGRFELQSDSETLKQIHTMAVAFGCKQCDIVAAIMNEGMKEMLRKYSCHITSKACSDTTAAVTD